MSDSELKKNLDKFTSDMRNMMFEFMKYNNCFLSVECAKVFSTCDEKGNPHDMRIQLTNVILGGADFSECELEDLGEIESQYSGIVLSTRPIFCEEHNKGV